MSKYRILMAIAITLVSAAVIVSAAQAAKGGGKGKPPAEPTATPVPPAPCADCPIMFVEAVDVLASDSLGQGIQAWCDVTISDELGNHLEGAQVDIEWSGHIFSGPGSAVTQLQDDGNIYASIYTTKGGRCKTGEFVACTVMDVSMDGWQYDSALNVETIGSSTQNPESDCG